MIKIVWFIILTSILNSQELYLHPYWLKLLHYKNGESQIDDFHFFLSKTGKISPKDELLATLKAIKIDNPQDANSTQCIFPARTRWLKNMLPKDNIQECKSLVQKLRELDFKKVYIVYASSFMNSPASAFGHTFLRFDNSFDTPLLSYGVTYSAKIDTHNILSYIYRGVLGGFEGRYNIALYYSIVNRYSNIQSRDIWEYRLKFTPQEIEKMTLHIIEMQRFYSDYYFNSKNCSYNLLWFIDLARDDLRFSGEFNDIVTPLDIIKALKASNLIDKVTLRASKITKIKALYQSIEKKEIAQQFYNNPNISLIEKLSTEEQRDILDLRILKKSSSELLSYRSKLGVSKTKKIVKTDPTYANLASKLNLSIFDKQLLYGIRVAYHDIFDIDYDFNLGEYITFFDIQMLNSRLNSINFLKIDSLAIIDELYHPISWGLDIGYQEDRLYIQTKVGISFSPYNSLIFYEPTINLSNNIELGYEMGFLKSINKVKFGAIIKRKFSNKIDRDFFITYQFDKNMAINIYRYNSKYSFGLFYYF